MLSGALPYRKRNGVVFAIRLARELGKPIRPTTPLTPASYAGRRYVRFVPAENGGRYLQFTDDVLEEDPTMLHLAVLDNVRSESRIEMVTRLVETGGCL